MNRKPLSLLLDVAFETPSSVSLKRPVILGEDIYPTRVDVCTEECTHKYVTCDLRKWMYSISPGKDILPNQTDKLQPAAALFFSTPFPDRLSQTVMEVMKAYELFPMCLYGNNVQVCYMGSSENRTAWSCVWSTVCPSVKTYGVYDNTLLWCDDTSVTYFEIMNRLSTLSEKGVWIQAIMLDQIELWLSHLSHFKSTFTHASILASTQSDFPCPKLFLVFSGYRKKCVLPVRSESMITECVREGFLEFYHGLMHKIRRNTIRIRWLNMYPNHAPDVFLKSNTLIWNADEKQQGEEEVQENFRDEWEEYWRKALQVQQYRPTSPLCVPDSPRSAGYGAPNSPRYVPQSPVYMYD